jgi:hypothetical protein
MPSQTGLSNHSHREAEAKVELQYYDDQPDPLIALTVTFRSFDTLDTPDYWQITCTTTSLYCMMPSL